MNARLGPALLATCTLLTASGAHAAACLADPVQLNPNMVTSVFGKTRMLSNYTAPHVHWGVDFQARNPQNPTTGADLLAVDNGTVIGAGYWGAGYGNRVALRRDNGDIVIYSHLAQVEPSLKSGGAVGFRGVSSGVGSVHVTTGQKIGVAGGTADHMDSNQLAVHLHLEYVTDYSGDKLRETNDGTDRTRSRYMRNALTYMCAVPPLAAGAAANVQGGGRIGPQQVGSGVTDNPNTPNSDAQIQEAREAQPEVTDRERYGIPDAPPYETYEGMSEEQIVEAEMLRRSLDTEWEEKLAGWGKRGIWMEIARMRAAKLWLQQRIAEKQSRIEGLLATELAFQTNRYFSPRLNDARNRAELAAAQGKVK